MFLYPAISVQAVLPTVKRPQKKQAGHMGGIKSVSE
jgi:hypothetical protein